VDRAVAAHLAERVRVHEHLRPRRPQRDAAANPVARAHLGVEREHGAEVEADAVVVRVRDRAAARGDLLLEGRAELRRGGQELRRARGLDRGHGSPLA
jgi:hypothetical protein